MAGSGALESNVDSQRQFRELCGDGFKFQLPGSRGIAGWLFNNLGLKKALAGILLLVAAAFHTKAQAQSGVNLAWDASTGAQVASYRVYYGGGKRVYTNTVNAGTVTSATVTGLTIGGTYYFAITALGVTGLESEFSTELVYTVPTAGGAPVVVLTSPVAGANYTTPTNISLAANVTSNGHTITKVQFYNGSTLLGEDTSSPYSFAWSSVSAGSHSLSTRAVYDSGSTVSSTAVNVTVSDPSGSGTPSGGGFASFTNAASITIADAGAGAPYP